ncbi:MAG: acyl-CoA carboxylase subunit beta [Myxococcales bacterium]
MSSDAKIKAELHRIEKGGAAKYHQKNAEQGKLFARERVRLLLDEGSFVEDGALANAADPELPADGVITGLGKIAGRLVALMANDSTVKAGSWGRRTVEKIVRIQEQALKLRCPMVYLVDSAGARITDQLEMFPGRRGAGRIFHLQCQLSGLTPQLCLLFGPSAAGGAYIPAFCDVVVMVEGNASMYLGSPRMAEMVIGEKVTLEELGGARMHCAVSGCGDVLVKTEEEAIEAGKRYLGYLPESFESPVPVANPVPPAASGKRIEELIPPDQNKFFDMFTLIRELVDEGSLFEIKKLFAPEVITCFARIEGKPVGIVASQPKHKGGVLFVDSADKAARFIWLCDAFGVPLLYLADVPGFMIGTKVEREGIIRAGAKMIMAVSEATVPKLCVVVRKAYGAGLYAFCGPGFEPDATIALPTAKIAVMGAEAAVNAVYANKIAALPEDERAAFVADKRAEYERDIDIMRLASELVVDAVIEPAELRDEVVRRFAAARGKDRQFARRRHGITPV